MPEEQSAIALGGTAVHATASVADQAASGNPLAIAILTLIVASVLAGVYIWRRYERREDDGERCRTCPGMNALTIQVGTLNARVEHLAQAAQVRADLWAHIQACQTKYAGLLGQISGATTVSAVQAVSW